MSAWWLLLIVSPAAYRNGHRDGYGVGFKAGSSWTVKTERRS